MYITLPIIIIVISDDCLLIIMVKKLIISDPGYTRTLDLKVDLYGNKKIDLKPYY